MQAVASTGQRWCLMSSTWQLLGTNETSSDSIMGCRPHRRMPLTPTTYAMSTLRARWATTTPTMAITAFAQLWMVAKQSKLICFGRKQCVINSKGSVSLPKKGKYKIADAKASINVDAGARHSKEFLFWMITVLIHFAILPTFTPPTRRRRRGALGKTVPVDIC